MKFLAFVHIVSVLKSCAYQLISYAETCNTRAVDLSDGKKKIGAMLGGGVDMVNEVKA